jgi:hypothetical protein
MFVRSRLRLVRFYTAAFQEIGPSTALWHVSPSGHLGWEPVEKNDIIQFSCGVAIRLCWA